MKKKRKPQISNVTLIKKATVHYDWGNITAWIDTKTCEEYHQVNVNPPLARLTKTKKKKNDRDTTEGIP